MTASYTSTQDQDQQPQEPEQAQADDILLADSDSEKPVARVQPSRKVKPARQHVRPVTSPETTSQNDVPAAPPRPRRIVTPVPHRPRVAMPIFPAPNGKAKTPLPPTNGHTQNEGTQWSEAGGAENQRSEAERISIHPSPDPSIQETGPLPPTNGRTQNGHVPNVGEQRQLAIARSRKFGELLTQQKQAEIEDGNIILHRSPNFFLRTVYQAGQKVNPLRRPTGNTTMLPRVMPQQEKRIANSETRLMPKVTLTGNLAQTKPFLLSTWVEAVVVVLGLMVSFVAHAYNMFNFPRYELDEGTYMSSAWAILNGLITPYPYGYGHPPLAWIQIAGWVQLTGCFFTFGNALNSGRVLMLLFALGCSLLVYLIVRRMGGSRAASLLAMIIFSLSPISLTYQRQVLLDNVGIFWLLLSIYFIVMGNSRLLYIVLGGISFGVALLSKEIFLLFLPVMIYGVWLHTTKFQRKFALIAFSYTVVALGSTFILLALLKGELLPSGWLPWDHQQHLSLLDTFLNQAQRSQSEGSLSGSWSAWTSADIILMAFSIITVIFNLIVGWWNRKHLFFALLAVSFWVLLVRGGVVLSFYIIPLIPLAAINAAIAINTVMGWLSKLVHLELVRALLILIIIGVIVPYDLLHSQIVFTQHPTSAQTDAMVWIRNNVPHNDVIVINSYLYMDLREPGGQGVGDGPTYPYAHVYFNIAYDPELYSGLLQGNPDRIDYIVADSEMLNDIKTFGGPMLLIDKALNHSVLRAQFRADDHDSQIVISIYQVIHQIAPPIAYQGPAGAQGTAFLYDKQIWNKES